MVDGGARHLDDELEAGAGAHLERSVQIGVFWKFVSQAGIQTIRLATVVVLARLLSPADYGAAALAISLAMYAPTVGDMGMGSAVVQTQRANHLVRSTAFWSALAFGIALSALFSVAAIAAGWILDDARIGAIMSVGALTFAISATGAIHQAMRVRRMDFRAIELRYLVALSAAGACAVVAAAGGLGPWALVLQQIVLVSGFSLALWWRADWRPAFEFSVQVFRELRSFALRIAGSRWARLAEVLIVYLLIGKLVGVDDLGAWTFAMSTVILPVAIIAVPTAEVLFSAFSRMRGDRERVSRLWLESITVLAAVILPLLVGLIVVAPDVVPLVFGSQWDVAVPLVQILSLYVVIHSLQAWSTVILDAAGKPGIALRTQIAALCLVPIAVLVGSQWGIEGVAAGFVLGQLLAVETPIFILVLVELGLGPGRLLRRLAGVAAATLVMAAACLLVRLVLLDDAGPALRAVATISLGAAVYTAALSILAPDLRRRAFHLVKAGMGRARSLTARTTT